MFVGAICHDLDHRGFNNKFMIDIGSPLAAIYSTSTMEHHHFNMTVTILQQVKTVNGGDIGGDRRLVVPGSSPTPSGKENTNGSERGTVEDPSEEILAS